ncbi:hypothetical protein [Kitasatospora sp. NPDC088346]|uniref:hypothetical protein n=1 Tax=Kitasatospora sp. NPDC088346 TaxID=3364073 RepID=UPI00380D6655
MYLRKIQRRNKDGSVVHYLQLAHNRRKDGTTQAEVLVNFGREDRLDVEGCAAWSPRSTATSVRRTTSPPRWELRPAR